MAKIFRHHERVQVVHGMHVALRDGIIQEGSKSASAFRQTAASFFFLGE